MIYFFGFINFNFDVVFNNVYLCKLISFSFSGKHTIWLYLLWWHIDCLEIWHHQKLPWDCPEVAMRLPWCCPEVALRLLWGCTEDALRFARNCLKHVPWLNCAPMVALRLPWGCLEVVLCSTGISASLLQKLWSFNQAWFQYISWKGDEKGYKEKPVIKKLI